MMWRIAFQVLPVLAWLLALVVVVRRLELKRFASSLVAFLLALAFGKFAFFAIVGGNSFTPDLPQRLIWFCGWAYASAFFLTAFSFVAAVVWGVMRKCGCTIPLRIKRICIAGLLVVAMGMSTWGMYESLCALSVRKIEVAWSELPTSFDGYRIAHLSDLHCSSAARRERIERIVKAVNALDVDLVAITGDFVDGSVQDRKDDFAPIADIRAKDGMIGCTGNHEMYWDWPGWSRMFRIWKLRFPEEDGPFFVRRGEDSLVFGGLKDHAFDRTGIAADAFSGVPLCAFRILLFHRPFTDKIESEAADVKLQLSGHTHGGAMPIMRQLVSRFNEQHVRGLYEFAPGRFLHVSPGTGQWAGFPLRILTPAEITVITLRRK